MTPTGGGVEKELREKMASSGLLDLRTGNPEADDPRHGERWAPDRAVRAESLANLLIDVNGSRRPQALRLVGARITGALNLEAAELLCPVLLGGCWFEEPLDLAGMRAETWRLPGCRVPGLNAEQLATRGNLELNDEFIADGEVNLRGSHIGGRLDLSGATLANPNGQALLADGLLVDQDMWCDRLTADGAVVLGGHIRGLLDFQGATLNNPGGLALFSDGLTVDSVMFCRKGFTTQGEVRLPAARIGGRLYFDGAKLSNPGGTALAASRLTVGQDMFCRKRVPEDKRPFLVEGRVDLRDAHIGGNLDCAGATLTNQGGCALDASGLIVDQDMRCTEGFSAVGAVNLRGARVGKQLAFIDATLSNPAPGPDQWTLILEQAETQVLVFKPVGAGNSATLGDLGVFVEEPAEPVVPDDFGIGAGGLR